MWIDSTLLLHGIHWFAGRRPPSQPKKDILATIISPVLGIIRKDKTSHDNL